MQCCPFGWGSSGGDRERGHELDAIISLRGVTKRFGSHTVLEDITLRPSEGQDQRHHGPVRYGQVRAPEEHHRAASPRRRRDLGRRRRDRAHGGEGPLPRAPQVRRPLPGRRAVRIDSACTTTSRSRSASTRTSPRRKSARSSLDEARASSGCSTTSRSFRARCRAACGSGPASHGPSSWTQRSCCSTSPTPVSTRCASSYLDELVKKTQEETGATFFIITHNIPSVMRTADYIGVLFRSGLVKFASKEEMVDAGRPDHQAVPRRPGPRARSAWTSWRRADRHRARARANARIAALAADGVSPEEANAIMTVLGRVIGKVQFRRCGRPATCSPSRSRDCAGRGTCKHWWKEYLRQCWFIAKVSTLPVHPHLHPVRRRSSRCTSERSTASSARSRPLARRWCWPSCARRHRSRPLC